MSDHSTKSVELQDAPTVYVVDDNEDHRVWISDLLKSIAVRVKTYSCPSEVLSDVAQIRYGCIVMDVRLPEMGGLLLHQKLLEAGVSAPVIMISAYAEVSTAVEALKAGAIDFIQKPSSAQDLLDRVQVALEVARERHEMSQQLSDIRERYAALSPREIQVLTLLNNGLSTKEIAAALEIGLTTVDFHRKNLLGKMQVDNIVELTQLMDQFRQLDESIGL